MSSSYLDGQKILFLHHDRTCKILAVAEVVLQNIQQSKNQIYKAQSLSNIFCGFLSEAWQQYLDGFRNENNEEKQLETL